MSTVGVACLFCVFSANSLPHKKFLSLQESKIYSQRLNKTHTTKRSFFPTLAIGANSATAWVKESLTFDQSISSLVHPRAKTTLKSFRLGPSLKLLCVGTLLNQVFNVVQLLSCRSYQWWRLPNWLHQRLWLGPLLPLRCPSSALLGCN